MRRGEVWWADLPDPVNRRPVLLLSRDRAYKVRNAVTVAFLTTIIRNIPVEVKLTPADGVPKECVINLDLINTIPKSALTVYICTISPAKFSRQTSGCGSGDPLRSRSSLTRGGMDNFVVRVA